MFTVLLPGSFNPPTLGHFKLMEHASLLCNNPYVGPGYRFEKPYSLFSIEEIVELLRDVISRLGNVSVHVFNGLVSALPKNWAHWRDGACRMSLSRSIPPKSYFTITRRSK